MSEIEELKKENEELKDDLSWARGELQYFKNTFKDLIKLHYDKELKGYKYVENPEEELKVNDVIRYYEGGSFISPREHIMDINYDSSGNIEGFQVYNAKDRDAQNIMITEAIFYVLAKKPKRQIVFRPEYRCLN